MFIFRFHFFGPIMPNLRCVSDRRAGLDLSDRAPFVAQTFEASENQLKLLGRHHVYYLICHYY